MSFNIGDYGQTAANAATGGIFGIALGGLQNKQNYDQANRLGRLNNTLAKEMGLFNYEQQMKMWEATNYKAQVEQLKKAGLNPGLLYGHSGPGGSTGAAAASSSGAPAVHGSDVSGMMGMGLQMRQQSELLKAQTENVKADTQAKLANAGLGGAQQKGQEIQNSINEQTINDQVKQARLINDKLWQDAYSEAVETTIAQGLFDGQKQLLAAQIVNTAQQTAESKSKVKVNEQDILNMREQINVMKQEVKESIQRIAQSQTTQDLMYDQMKNLFNERRLTYEQQQKVMAETKTLLNTADLQEYEKGLQNSGLRNPIVQSIMGVVENAAGGFGAGKGVGGALRRMGQRPVGFQGNWNK